MDSSAPESPAAPPGPRPTPGSGAAATVDVLSRTSSGAVAEAIALGVRRGRATTDYRRFYRENVVAPWMRVPAMPVVRQHDEGVTTKFTQALEPGPDGRVLETESVILPQRSSGRRDRITLCVSSQVGCAMGCGFCETARMGRMRQLTTAEIVGQWHEATFGFGASIDNVVFMGMGEPMDNIDAVLPAIEVLADHNGPAVAASRITVSTVGHAEGIRRYADFADRDGFRRLNLAVSLNAPDDAIRNELMPINRSTPLDELFAAMHEWVERVAARILIEYVLIPGVNDADAHADALVARLEGLPATINVIPYNPRRDSPWPAPEEADVIRFTGRIAAGGRLVKRRRTMGRTVMGACGQLGNPAIRNRRFVPLGQGPAAAG